MLREQLFKMASYNYWANEICTGFILAAGEQIANQELPGSFPSIRLTCFHIWDAELVWLKRLQGLTIPSWPPSAGFTENLEKGMEQVLMNSNAVKHFTKTLTEADLQKTINYKNNSGKEFSTKIADILFHCFNHSTYHRGQVITMLRQAGFRTVNSTDFITYCRVAGSE